MSANDNSLTAADFSRVVVLALSPGLLLILVWLVRSACVRVPAKPLPCASDSPVLTDLLERLHGAVLTEAVVRTRFRLGGTCIAWAYLVLGQGPLQHMLAWLSAGANVPLFLPGALVRMQASSEW